MKSWDATLRSEARRQVQDICISVQLFGVARTSCTGGDEIHKAGSPFLGDRRERGANLEERHLQATKGKVLGIIDEMREMFKKWRREDVARRAAESTMLDQSLVLYQPTPTARSNPQDINTEPISSSKFDSAAVWDVIDDEVEEDEELLVEDDEIDWEGE